MKTCILIAPFLFASCAYIPRPLGYTGGEATYGRVAADYSTSTGSPTLQVIFTDASGNSVARYHIKDKDLGYDYNDFANATFSNGQMHLDLINASQKKLGELTVDAKRGIVSKSR